MADKIIVYRISEVGDVFDRGLESTVGRRKRTVHYTGDTINDAIQTRFERVGDKNDTVRSP